MAKKPAKAAEAEASTVLVPLADLYIHPLNARSEPPAADIAALADSIADLGLLQNLAGFAEPAVAGLGIVAGGRRLRALQLLCTRDGRDPAETRVPVRVTDDEATARLWASAENAAREALHPADEVRAYGRMQASGADPERIAKAFAVTVRHVRQRLRLAQLPVEALDALRGGEITLDQAAALTAARDDESCIEALTAAIKNQGYYNSGPDAIRNRLAQASVSATDRRVRYIGLDAYRAAGGRVQEDLFTDATRLLDEEIVAQLFGEALQAAARAEQAARGWMWIEINLDSWPDYTTSGRMQRIQKVPLDLPDADIEELEDLTLRAEVEVLPEKDEARLEDLETRAEGDYAEEDIATSGGWIYVDGDGDLCFHGPYRRPEDDPGRAPGEDGDQAVAVAARESAAISGSLLADLARIRLAALQAAVMQDPPLIWDLLQWQMSGTVVSYGQPLDLTLTPQNIQPEILAGTEVPSRLTDGDSVPHKDQTYATAEAFLAFRNLDSSAKGRILDRTIARAIIDGRDYLPALAALAQPYVRRIWTPTAAGYFSRLPVAHLDRIWCSLVDDGLEPTHAKFRALKKGEKAQLLHKLFNDADFREAIGTSREANAAIDCWLPEQLQWPAVETPETNAEEAA